jgi:hypothetical protein
VDQEAAPSLPLHLHILTLQEAYLRCVAIHNLSARSQCENYSFWYVSLLYALTLTFDNFLAVTRDTQMIDIMLALLASGQLPAWTPETPYFFTASGRRIKWYENMSAVMSSLSHIQLRVPVFGGSHNVPGIFSIFV